MDCLQTVAELRAFVAAARGRGKSVSFVPTMGALHGGHLELVRQGLARCDVCIPYIFLNPKQFAPTEDLASYPRTLEADLEKLERAGASAVYLPRAAEVYADDFSTSIEPKGVALPLEGEFRPVMFGGVATVVAKMLLRCLPDLALFGEKDYQQLLVIRQTVRDLDIPVEIVGIPTVRDENGLALSSRNAYLSDAEYAVAAQLNKTIEALAENVRGGMPTAEGEARARKCLLDAGFASVDYVAVRDATTLLPPEPGAKNLRVLAAAQLGRARLIDNIPLML